LERGWSRLASGEVRFDEIGYWSEIKLDIVRKYARAYSVILTRKKSENSRFSHAYIDGFAGSGVNISRSTGEWIPGSPLNALNIEPKFDEYYLIDLDGDKVSALKAMVGNRSDVHIFHGDCNEILLRDVFPKISYESCKRALCLLDPYGLHLQWKVIECAGKMGTIDLFLNFPVMDINRNALWRNPEGVQEYAIERMNAFWGDESWRDIAYEKRATLFGYDKEIKRSNEEVAEAFRKRLCEKAGFKHVPKPMPMRNSKGSIVYYLYFASQKQVAERIIKDIFRKYESRSAQHG
jgi:three-Cys-motif partner protein